MFDYGAFRFGSKNDLFDKAIRFWNPDKTRFWQEVGVDLVIDQCEGYCLYDMSGRRLIDLHLSGRTNNNAETEVLGDFDELDPLALSAKTKATPPQLLPLTGGLDDEGLRRDVREIILEETSAVLAA